MDTERSALVLSCTTALVMAALALVFAFITNSRAILLDGLFNLMYFGGGLLTLKVARLIRQPDTTRFPFGYGYFESMLNAGKGLAILGVSLIALADSAIALASGGRVLAAGPGILYAAVATVLCSATAWVLHRRMRRIDSPLVHADSKNWILDAAISASTLIAFCLAALLPALGWGWTVRYIDPVLVAAMVLLLLGVPVRMARDAILELLNRSPMPATERPVVEAIDHVLDRMPLQTRYVRMVRPGRGLYVVVHAVVNADAADCRVSDLDAWRAELDDAVRRRHPWSVVDVVFTADSRWAAPATGLGQPAA